MKILTVLICLCVPLMGADKKPLIADPIVEKAVRKSLKKPTGELTKADLEKVRKLNLNNNQLISVKGLEKLMQLRLLDLNRNPDLTKAQINELQKALPPKCKIYSNLPLTKEESAKVIEATIREAAKKPTGKLTKADYEKVTTLAFFFQQLTDVKGLEKLTNLTVLDIRYNYYLPKAQIDELTKSLPKCDIYSNPKQ